MGEGEIQMSRSCFNLCWVVCLGYNRWATNTVTVQSVTADPVKPVWRSHQLTHDDTVGGFQVHDLPVDVLQVTV